MNELSSAVQRETPSRTLNAGSATRIFLAFFIAQLLVAALLYGISGDRLGPLGDFLFPIVGAAAMVSVARRLIPKEDLRKAGPTGPAWVLGGWENLIKGLAIGCIVGGAGHLWNALNRPHWQHHAQFVEPINQAIVTPGAQQILAIVALALLAPTAEEMMFRGILYGGYRKSFGPISAALVTTILFVAMHLPYYIYAPYSIVYYIVSALVLLWCRVRWNAIGPAIAAHGGLNIAASIIPALLLMWQYDFAESGVKDYKASNFKQAIANLTHAIQLGDHSSGAYVYRGSAKFGEGDFDGAISDYSMGIILNPKDSWAFYNRGLAKRRKADFEGAIADYDEAIKLSPKYSRAYFDRGLAWDGETNFDAAIADYPKAIELDPTNSLYYNERGWVEFEKGDFGYSIADATRSIELDPNFGDAYGTRGWARYSVGNVAGAVEDCKTSTRLYKPGSADFFADQGLLDFIAKDYTQAIADWQNAIQQEPDFKQELIPWIEKARKSAGAGGLNSSNRVNQTEPGLKR